MSTLKMKTGNTFYDPELATKELVDEVFDIVNNREKALRVCVHGAVSLEA